MEYTIITGTGVNPPVLTLNGQIALTHFNSLTRQLFETSEGSFVYMKDTQTLITLTLDSYTSLLLKLNNFINVELYE